MKVVLLQDVKKLGKRGDVVEVADSYGRNVLIRRGLGAEGTKANLNTAEQRRESKEFKSKVAADEAVIMASQLKKVKAVIKVQSGEDGRVFGSVTAKDICDAQREDGCIPDVAPAYWNYYSDNMTWPAALLLSCDMMYTQYGNKQPIERHYDAMKRWLKHMREEYMTEDFILTKDKYGDLSLIHI
mgnify:CR=1 FL=1